MKIIRNLLLGFTVAIALAACGQASRQQVRHQHGAIYLSEDGSTAYTRAYDDDTGQLIWWYIVLSDSQRASPITASTFNGGSWARSETAPAEATLQQTEFAVAEVDGVPTADVVDADTVEASDTITEQTSAEQAADIGSYESIGSDGDGNWGGGDAADGGGFDSGADSGSYDSGSSDSGGSFDSGGDAGGGGDF